MAGGTPVGRQWVVILRDGAVVIDWGGGVFQDILSGDFISVQESQISHTIRDAELDWLKKTGRVTDFDDQQVFFPALPDRPLNLMP